MKFNKRTFGWYEEAYVSKTIGKVIKEFKMEDKEL